MAGPTAEELETLSRDHWWRGDLPGCIRLDEELYALLVAEDRRTEAADRALRLCLEWANRGDVAVATAWLGRARRLLEDLCPGVVHGYLKYVEASIDLDFDGDPAAAVATAAEIEALAQAHPDPTLRCFALTLSGFATIRGGQLEGFATIDEALLSVVSGQVDPLWAGDIYCSAIHLCEALGDLARMRAWTDALATWAARLSSTFIYAGITRIHQLQLLIAEGQWDRALEELAEQSADLVGVHGWLAGAGFYELGEVRRLRAEDDAARAAYATARSLGVEPQPGEAELLHATGRSEEALAALRIALAGQGSLARSRLIVPTVEIALSLGEDSFAASLADELDLAAARFGTPGLTAAAARARAACLLEKDEAAEAVRLLDGAARIYREQRFHHASARVHEALAAAYSILGSTEMARAGRATAMAIYERLGAVADLRRLTPSRRAGDLTEREAEVLAQVAAGLTNKQVAAALSISDKTVSRHLGNIFTKLGVTSRTAAAAWAHGRGVAR